MGPRDKPEDDGGEVDIAPLIHPRANHTHTPLTPPHGEGAWIQALGGGAGAAERGLPVA